VKLVAALVAGALLGAASVAVAAPLNWKKSGNRYVCTGGPNNVRCLDASPGAIGQPLNIGHYEMAIEGQWLAVNFAHDIENGVPVNQKTILRCNRRVAIPARGCAFSP